MNDEPATLNEQALVRVADELSKTKTWVVVIAYGTYFLGALGLVLGVIEIVRTGPPERFGSTTAPLAILVAVLTAFLYVGPAIILHRFARSISRFQGSHTIENLLEALVKGSDFWRLLATWVAVVLALMLLFLPGSLFSGL